MAAATAFQQPHHPPSLHRSFVPFARQKKRNPYPGDIFAPRDGSDKSALEVLGLPQHPEHYSINSNYSYTSSSSPPPPSNTALTSSHTISATKLHKRTSKSTASKSALGQRKRSDNALAGTSTPPTISEDDFAASPISLTITRSSTRSNSPMKLKQNLRKLSHQKRLDENTLDMSQTLEENQERTGLGIGGLGCSAPRRTAADVDFISGSIKRGHGRSSSYGSPRFAQATFKPSTPWVHPAMTFSPKPYAHSNMGSYPNSIAESDEEMLNDSYDSPLQAKLEDAATNPRPSLRINTSQGSSTRPSRTNTNLSYATTAASTIFTADSRTDVSRQTSITQPARRSTSISSFVETPHSRKSIDRAFSLIVKNHKAKDEFVDSQAQIDAEADAIRAARLAFDTKQIAKEQKYESQQQKERERLERRQRRSEDRERKRSTSIISLGPQTSLGKFSESSRRSASISYTISGTQEETERTVCGREYSALTPVPSHYQPALTKEETTDYFSNPVKVTKKRKAKGVYFTFATWFRTKMLQMKRRQQRSESAASQA